MNYFGTGPCFGNDTPALLFTRNRLLGAANRPSGSKNRTLLAGSNRLRLPRKNLLRSANGGAEFDGLVRDSGYHML